MKLRPLQDQVLIRRVEPETKSSGGIFIPDMAQKKAMAGDVLAVGPGARDAKGTLIAFGVKAGDRVLFDHASGSTFKVEGENLVIMAESDILGVVD